MKIIGSITDRLIDLLFLQTLLKFNIIFDFCVCLSNHSIQYSQSCNLPINSFVQSTFCLACLPTDLSACLNSSTPYRHPAPPRISLAPNGPALALGFARLGIISARVTPSWPAGQQSVFFTFKVLSLPPQRCLHSNF